MINLKKFYFLKLFLLLLVSACQIAPTAGPEAKKSWLAPGLLNSQRIELKYGSYGIDILDQNDSWRLANLYSFKDEKKITRTIAYTRYQTFHKNLLAAHQEILAGGSIGSTLKAHGFSVKKDFFFVDEISFPQSLFGYLPEEKALAVIYDLNVEKEGQVLPYCTILEVYNHDFLTKSEAEQIYAVKRPGDLGKAQAILTSFEQAAKQVK